MKCIHCNQEHPDDFMFCPITGAKLEPQKKACTNEECCDFGKYILPPEANFCPRCGHKIERQGSSGEGKNTSRTKNKKGESDGFINGHEYVDLGLPSGVKWATCNVGADSPEEYGEYYAWGENYTKDEYEKDNCNSYSMDDDISGNPDYDVATSEWGEDWRIPTKEECEELVEECEWRWMKKKGVGGMMHVTGPNGKSIFLPAAGYRCHSSLLNAGHYGHYWSSTPDILGRYAYDLTFHNGDKSVEPCYRRDFGEMVRPVSDRIK